MFYLQQHSLEIVKIAQYQTQLNIYSSIYKSNTKFKSLKEDCSVNNFMCAISIHQQQTIVTVLCY